MNPFVSQERYQVRLDSGLAGASRLAAADVLVIADAFTLVSAELSREISRAVPADHVLSTTVDSAVEVAAEIMTRQQGLGRRLGIAIVMHSRDVAGVERFLVENFFAAGALVAALGDLGIDHSSPDAAAAGEAYRSLRGGMAHLLSATSTAQALRAHAEGAPRP